MKPEVTEQKDIHNYILSSSVKQEKIPNFLFFYSKTKIKNINTQGGLKEAKIKKKKLFHFRWDAFYE